MTASHRVRALPPRAALIAAIAIAAAGCRQERPARVEIDQSRLAAALPARMVASIKRPDVQPRFEALGQGLTTDPQVVQASSALVAHLGQDPEIQAAGNAFVAEAIRDPVVIHAIQDLMRAHPGASSDEIGALTQQRIEAVTNGPEFQAAFTAAWNELLQAPDVNGAFRRLGDQIGRSKATLDLTLAAVVGHLDDAALQRRLTQLNGGRPPSRAKATDLFLEHAFSDDRLAGFWKDVTALPAIHDGLSLAARGLLESKAFQKDATTFVRTILTDETFRSRGVDVMVVLLSDHPDQATLHRVLGALLQTPAAHKAVATLVDQLITDPSLRTIAGDALAPIAKDPGLQKVFGHLLTEW